ncbi:MAG: S41 family peptidase [Ferruginibacter sp.]
MRNTILSFLICFLFSFLNKSGAQVPDNRVLEPGAMQQDFNYLRKALEETHPGLYMHHSKQEMQYITDSLYKSLNKPLAFFDFYKVVAYLVAEIKCEHTYCNPYGSKAQETLAEWKLIPLQLYFSGNKAYVAVNRSTDATVHIGDEVIFINSYPVDSVKHKLYSYIPADGNMEASKDVFLSSMSFNLSYYQFIERPDAFNITFKNKAGQTFVRRFDKDLSPEVSNANAVKNPSNKPIIEFGKRNRINVTDPCRLELLKDKNTAILTMRSFGGNREKLFKKYERFFNTLQKEKLSNLIIDLSFNGGGDEEFAAELLSYLISKPTRFINEEYIINDSDFYLKQTNIPREALKNKAAFLEPMKNGKALAKEQTEFTRELKLFEPKPNRFGGKVYFYINGGTSSAASTFAAVAQSNSLGTFIGEETAGSYAGGGTTNGLDLTLPNSGITTHTSIVYQSFATSGKNKDRGVIPDYPFIQAFENLVTTNDSWKIFILSLIEKNK